MMSNAASICSAVVIKGGVSVSTLLMLTLKLSPFSPDEGVLVLHLVQAFQCPGADPGGILHQFFVLDNLDGGERGTGCDRVLLVGVMSQRAVPRLIQFRFGDHGTDGQNSAAQGLAQHHDIRNDLIMLAGEHAACLS